MKLIIDITDYEYKNIKEYYEKNDTVEATYSYIYHGIPLPKGHGDLVDADKMIKELNERIQIFDEGRNEILKELGRPEENNQIPLWLWKGCCITCGIIIEADKEKTKNDGTVFCT